MRVETDTQKILAELERILASAVFAKADRPGRLLRFLVEETLSGKGCLKESILAVTVFGRHPGFDPKTDPIVRVEVSRLRSRLELFYASEGRVGAVRIVLPKGNYVPVFEALDPVAPSAVPAGESRKLTGHKYIWVSAVAAAFLAGLWVASFRAPAKPEVSSLSMLPPAGTTLLAFAVSPDGSRIALTAAAQGTSRLYLRRLDSFTARVVPNTETAAYPFWSPDGKSVGFFTLGKLKVLDVAGGAPRTLCDAPLGRGGTWGANGDIVFAPGALGPLLRISSDGGQPKRVTTLSSSRNEVGHRWPHFLPDGRHFLYFAVGGDPELSGIEIGSLQSEQARRLIQASSPGIPFQTDGRDYILYQRGEVLYGQRFDWKTGTISGEPFAIGDRVRFDPLSRYTLASGSTNGLLAYVPGSPFDQELVWVDRTGGEVQRIGDPGDYISMRISPDGLHAALSRSDPRSGWPSIWNLDLTRGSMYPVASPTVDWFPVWSADAAKIVYSSASLKAEAGMVLRISSSVGDHPRTLRTINGPAFPSDWSPDGSSLVYTAYAPGTGSGIWIAPMSHEAIGDPRPLIDSEYNEGGAVFFPAGGHPQSAWLAYTSNESGRDEVYVQSFPGQARKIKISLEGGSRPLWRVDGKELYFVDLRGFVMAAGIRDGRTMQTDAPQELFRIATPPPHVPPYALNYATSDGSRFLVRRARAEGDVNSIAIVTHWRN